MNATRKNRGLRSRWIAAALIAAGLAPSAVAAQSWELHSGLNPHREVLRGVVDVRYCPGGGMASAGAQEMPPGTPGGGNIVVERVYTATPSAPLTPPSWRYSYDSGFSEYGGGIVEYTDGSGFAVVASRVESTSPQVTRLTISKIDCNGNMVWHRGYGLTGGYNISWDIIRADSGTPALGTNPGDLIAVGEYTVNGFNYVRVVRAEKNLGNLIWTRDYSMPAGVQSYGRGIAEVDTPSTTDHLIVAGGLGNNAAIFEVDGDNGAFVCGTQSPGLGISRFNDITRHGGATGIAPGFTAVGDTRAPGAPSQAYIASYVTGPTAPCAIKKQIHWGVGTDNESAQAVTTTLGASFSGVPAGQLLIAGNVVGPYSTNPNSADVWTHVMTPNVLTPFVSSPLYPSGQRYGTFLAGLSGAETVADVAESTGGGYFVGMTTSPWIIGDPQQGYSTWMDFNGTKTGCSVPWKAPAITLATSSPFTLSDPRYDPSVWLHPLPRKPIKAEYCCNYSP